MKEKELLLDFLKFHYKDNQFRKESTNEKDVDLYFMNRKKTVITVTVIFPEEIVHGFWYTGLIGQEFKVKEARSKGDLRDVEGFGLCEPEECWIVTKGEYEGNLILKEHCI